MKIFDIIYEAGEPENPSRRGFLKALGAAGVAAAMPGTAMKALAEPTAAEVPAAAAAAAGESGLIGRLWQAAANYWLDRMMDDDDRGYSNYDDEFRGSDDDEDEWDDENEWDDDIKGPNEDGRMPWGEYYEVMTTPSGHKVLHTGAPDGQEGIFAYEKNGEIRYIALACDTSARDYGEVVSSNSDEDEDLYYAYGEQFGGIGQEEGLAALFDYIINGDEDPSGHYSDDAPVWHQYPDKEPQADKTTATGTTAADLARLAGLAKRGYDAAMTAGEPEEPQAEPQKPQALPRPTEPDIDLAPDLKQKQAEPAKKKPNES